VAAARRLRLLMAHLRRVGTDERLRSAAVTYGRLDYPHAPVLLRLSSREEFHRLRSCEKEPWTVRWIEEYVKPGEVLYDVGANIGAYTLLAAVAVPELRVVSFEPSPANFAALCANLELNEVGGRVTPIPLALGDHPRAARLDRDAAVPGTSPRFDDDVGHEEAIVVLVDRLDDVVERFGLPTPDHVKLDVDGSELEVLAGAESLLAGTGVRSVMAELERGREADLVERLNGFGFELVKRESGDRRGRATPAYGLFTRP
jgi:FkbM family methyltransferase